ncbi:MAG: hypothetical protein HUJ54_09865 [Erysipelotrichaceae bacterium]|nr:hypothetical protein [Erysipelotrichaceae bacterium]
MIDLHTHLLPGMDDGSSSVEESAEMLRILKQQGVDTVVLTPHFYAFREDPVQFLKRRRRAAEKIRKLVQSSGMDVRLGAEVHYYNGMSLSDLSGFLITGTNMILVEMPFRPWDDRTVSEILDLSAKYTVVLAHIERYFQWQPFDKAVWRSFEAAGILFQMNCTAVLHGFKSRKLIKLIQEGKIDFLCSDAHNLDRRPPRFDEAARVLDKKLPKDGFQKLTDRSRVLFESSQI